MAPQIFNLPVKEEIGYSLNLPCSNVDARCLVIPIFIGKHLVNVMSLPGAIFQNFYEEEYYSLALVKRTLKLLPSGIVILWALGLSPDNAAIFSEKRNVTQPPGTTSVEISRYSQSFVTLSDLMFVGTIILSKNLQITTIIENVVSSMRNVWQKK